MIEEKVVKVDGRAEADRLFNYPYNALEEALVNAVLHKNYKKDVPVEIRIYLDQIINFPRWTIILIWRSSCWGKSRQEDTEIPRLENLSRNLIREMGRWCGRKG